MLTRPTSLNHQNSPFTSAHVESATVGRLNSKGFAAVLLAAFVAALMAIADAFVDTYGDGHLLAGWIILWVTALTALALSANTARKTAAYLTFQYRSLSERAVRRGADAYLCAVARHDPRLMADIEAAIGRTEHTAHGLAGQGGKSVSSSSGFIATWLRRQSRARSDAMLWTKAQKDPRVMAEVQAAMQRAHAARQSMDQALGRAWLARHPVGTFNAAYQGKRNTFRTTPLVGLPTHLPCLPR